MVIAVDFDGTLCHHAFPEIGEEIVANTALIEECKREGDTIILWTCRKGKELAAAVEWMRERNIAPDYVNENTPEFIEEFGGDTRKVFAHVYLDDRAFLLDSVCSNSTFGQIARLCIDRLRRQVHHDATAPLPATGTPRAGSASPCPR